MHLPSALLRLFSSTATVMSATGLSTIARYAIRSSAGPNKLFSLVISGGSVVDFTYNDGKNAAIVNAANEGCLGGGGVDGAISDAGGPNLLADRMDLPFAKVGGRTRNGVRCPTGEAVITGPGDYGDLGVSYVIHAVGPNYMMYDNDDDSDSCEEGKMTNTNTLTSGYDAGDRLLRSAYVDSMRKAAEHGLAAVAFSLISSGIFRGRHSKKEVLKIGIEGITQNIVEVMAALAERDGGAASLSTLEEVHLCAFNAEEARLLTEICGELGLEKE